MASEEIEPTKETKPSEEPEEAKSKDDEEKKKRPNKGWRRSIKSMPLAPKR